MNLSILFVDDDSNIIGGLRRMMYPYKKEWELLYANGGKDAIEQLESNNVDVIISDIRMPGMDGTQLLTYVKENFPKVIRITLSGYADDSLSLKNTRIVHQSISKPATPERIRNTITKAYELRNKLSNESLLKFINSIDELPSLPAIYLELEEEINSKKTSLVKIAGIISKDPIICAKILQLTNSAFFGLPVRIANITQALNYLGIKIIQNLVLTIKLFKAVDSSNPLTSYYQELWNHSNNVALICQQICKAKNIEKSVSEDAFIAGLLHDIGKLILMDNLNKNNERDDISVEEFEKEIAPSTHTDIGAYLLGIWGLPDSVVEAVAYHHNAEVLSEEKLNASQIVFLANILSKMDTIDPMEISEQNIEYIIEESLENC